MKLPSLLGYSERRPNVREAKVNNHYVPDEEYKEFWDAFYEMLEKNFRFSEPLKGSSKKVNPFFGFFGLEFHPVLHLPKYFNLGLDITDKPKSEVTAVHDGVLEYAGFDLVNGKYVFLSHPQIKTEDGFVLHSLYMHLKKFNVRFSSYEKMLREISHNAYPIKKVGREDLIGEVGCTGNSCEEDSHLHLQLEFRHPDREEIIAINPAKVLGIKTKKNKTADIENKEEFINFYKDEKEEIKKWDLESYWTKLIKPRK